LCKTQNLLNKFTCYLFERRFGWSESNQDNGGRRVRRMSCTGITLEASDGQQKAFICQSLKHFCRGRMITTTTVYELTEAIPILSQVMWS
jgi:hypothetical protein